MYKRKNWYCYLLAAPALAVIVFSVYSGLSESNPDRAVQTLIKERTAILRNVSCGRFRPEEAKRRLRQIERDDVLTEDLAGLEKKRAEKAAGDFCFVDFKELKRKKTMFEYITYEARIQWDSGDFVRSGVYSITIQKEAGSFRLAVFEPAGEKYGQHV